MQLIMASQPLKCRDLASSGTESRRQTTVDRLAIQPDRAGAAIASVTPFFHAEPAKVPQQRPQALPGARLGSDFCAVDPKVHGDTRCERPTTSRVPRESVPRSILLGAGDAPATH